MNFPVIIQQTENKGEVIFELEIDASLDAFAGHFDTFPIVPGVVQIQWALHFFGHYMKQPDASSHRWQITKVTKLKFQHVITPRTIVSLALNYDDSKQSLSFALTSAEGQHSSGKLFLQAVEP
ncbi:ApeI family dehydratase [Kangiella shandongensis]|uniref:ApeI family dehydratase n=1 Tax=Kangiella shandongensis TaxID=2763258 RepID=UPI001CBDEC1F|nr:AMP-binding protein [Kangiella shandongensis]